MAAAQVFKITLLLGKEASPSIRNTVARFNDVHAFGYNSAESERIWMKFGALRECCLELSLTYFWARSAQKRERESVPKFFLSGEQRAISPTSGRPNFTKFAHNTCFRVRVNPFTKHLWKFASKGSFCQKGHKVREHRQRLPTSDRDFSEMNTNRGKSWHVCTHVECWLSIRTVGINSKSFPWPVQRSQKVYFRMPILTWFTYLKILTVELAAEL